MDGGKSDTRVLGEDAFEHTRHLFARQALMGFVVKPLNLLAVRVVADDAASAGVRHPDVGQPPVGKLVDTAPVVLDPGARRTSSAKRRRNHR